MPSITRRLLHLGLAVLAGAALLGACTRPAALQSNYQPSYAAWFITKLTGDETAAHGAA